MANDSSVGQSRIDYQCSGSDYNDYNDLFQFDMRN